MPYSLNMKNSPLISQKKNWDWGESNILSVYEISK